MVVWIPVRIQMSFKYQITYLSNSFHSNTGFFVRYSDHHKEPFGNPTESHDLYTCFQCLFDWKSNWILGYLSRCGGFSWKGTDFPYMYSGDLKSRFQMVKKRLGCNGPDFRRDMKSGQMAAIWCPYESPKNAEVVIIENIKMAVSSTKFRNFSILKNLNFEN